MKFTTKQHKSKYPFEPALGVKTDFETLLQRFSSAGTVRYEKFAECWREMNMATYCAGRQTRREAREFVEQCLSIAVQFWLPPSSFLVRAGALYLLYGLYYFQLVVPSVKIRITPEQWKQIEEFQQEAREQQHLDLDYIFQKMKLDKAFIFVATPDEVYSRRLPPGSGLIPDSLKEETSMVDEVFTSSALNQLALVHSQYQKMKQVLAEEDDSSLSIINSDLINSVYSTLKTHREKQAQATLRSQAYGKEVLREMAKEDEAGSSADDSVSVQKMLKQKAFEFTSPSSKKRPKKEPNKALEVEDIKTGEMMYDVQADTEKVQQKRTRGDLFEKDETENTPVELPQVHEIYQMPDLDSITPKPEKPENVKKEEVTESSKRKPAKKTRKKKDSRGKRKLSENNEQKSTDKKIKEHENTEILEAEADKEAEEPPRKKISGTKNSERSDSSESDSQTEQKLGKDSVLQKPEAEADEEEQGDEDEDLPSETESSDTVQKPSAQEILQMKLNKRKKEARLGASNRKRKKTKK